MQSVSSSWSKLVAHVGISIMDSVDVNVDVIVLSNRIKAVVGSTREKRLCVTTIHVHVHEFDAC